MMENLRGRQRTNGDCFNASKALNTKREPSDLFGRYLGADKMAMNAEDQY